MQALKKYKAILPIFVLVFMLFLPMDVWAAEPVDMTQTGELRVYFTREEAYPGVEFRLYQVATIDAECNYTLTEAFADANVVLENPTADDWRNLVTTLSGYVAGSNVEPDRLEKTNNNGVATFAQLPLGLYLVEGDSLTVTENDRETTVTPSAFLIQIPDLNEEMNGFIPWRQTASIASVQQLRKRTLKFVKSGRTMITADDRKRLWWNCMRERICTIP